MPKTSVSKSLGSVISSALGCMALLLVAANPLAAAGCPTATSAIDTDRPGVTNSATTVPRGSFQAENGSDWMAAHGSNFLTGSETRLRLGVAQCSEFLIDVPSYTGALNGSQPSGFSDVVVSFKRELPMPTGIHLSATAGLGFPSGSSKISGRGYQPYIQAPWSYRIGRGWSASGTFTLSWFPSESERNPTFGPAISLGRNLGKSANMAIEYGGMYSHQQPMHVLDTLGQWRFTNTQQLDFQAGFGLNRNTVDHFFGIGYSFRLDNLF
jgi:hypothetical protein